MNYLKRQIYFVESIKLKVIIAFILCVYLNFIIIGLQPFNTDEFKANNKFLLLSGFGIVIFLVFLFHSCIENIIYFRKGKFWKVLDEITSTVIFCLFSGTAIYFYNTIIVNNDNCSLRSYLGYLIFTVAFMLPIFIPFMLYLRQKFGIKTIILPKNSFILNGENKNEILRLEKDNLLFIKAVENYVEICFIDKNQKIISKTFRQTLSNVSEQMPFLEKCHRSYLVNINNIAAIIGNSQSAKLTFLVGEKEIPLSKTYYKDIKNCLL